MGGTYESTHDRGSECYNWEAQKLMVIEEGNGKFECQGFQNWVHWRSD